jgi:hypothetical protein
MEILRRVESEVANLLGHTNLLDHTEDNAQMRIFNSE